MKHIKYLPLLLALFVPVIAQEAKIKVIEKSDSEKLSSAYKEYKDAEKRWEEAKTEIVRKYTHADDPGGSTFSAWDTGVEFSPNFRAMIPKVSMSLASTNLWNCGTLTPLVSTFNPDNYVGAGTGGFAIDSPSSTTITGPVVIKDK
jgi:hypothetical protein